MPKRTDIHTIMIIGSGPIVIGQGCEFKPEASPIPHHSLYLFDEFVDRVKDQNRLSVEP